MKRYLLLGSIFIISTLHANNISVTNVTLTGQNVSAGVNNAANFTYIEFDLTWENSWLISASPNNWDAAWIFVKFRTVGSSTWNHVYLAPSGHNTSPTTPTTSYSVQVGLVNEGSAHNATTNPAVGAFIYRSANGTGTFTAQDIRLKWFYRDNGVGDNDIIDVDVYAIEMVYVPDGAFSIGNNGNSANAVNSFFKWSSPSHTSFEISSENAITAAGTVGAAAGTLGFGEFGNVAYFSIPLAFPKGYKGFYCMKYESSQQNWVDFLNSLTSGQQANLSQSGGTRNGITSTAGVFSTSTPFIPKQGNNWPDVASFLDWAGLRVMTELEYEKACRGTATVVTDEFAWGNTSYTNHITTLTNSGLTNEVSSVSSANTVLGVNNGSSNNQQIRCGAFAKASTTRADAGASFYGIMDLTGNGLETVAWGSTSTATATTYSGIHGNGTLTNTGYADVTLWPGLSSGAVTTTSAIGLRGGCWFDQLSNQSAAEINKGRIANRELTSSFTSTSRGDWYNNTRSVRGVHTKPITASETK